MFIGITQIWKRVVALVRRWSNIARARIGRSSRRRREFKRRGRTGCQKRLIAGRWRRFRGQIAELGLANAGGRGRAGQRSNGGRHRRRRIHGRGRDAVIRLVDNGVLAQAFRLHFLYGQRVIQPIQLVVVRKRLHVATVRVFSASSASIGTATAAATFAVLLFQLGIGGGRRGQFTGLGRRNLQG